MNKIDARLIWMLSAIVLLMGAGIMFCISRIPKQGYVVNQQIFEGFKGKKELESKLDALKLSHQSTLDSMELYMGMLHKAGLRDSLLQYQYTYKLKKDEFSGMEDEQAEAYTRSIWLQIDKYMKEYGRQHNYDYIMGTSGEGNLMYVREENDITAPVLEYINQRYEGN